MTTQQAFALAFQHHQAGRLAEAEALYRQALAAQPNHADALHFLGVIAHQVGRREVAIDLIRRALVLNPNNPGAHSNLGEVCHATGRFDEAIVCYRQALALQPGYAMAHNNLGTALARRGQLDDAIAAYRRALALQPDFPDAHNKLAIALARQGNLDAAIATFRQAIQVRPDYAETHNNLGIALARRGQLDEAVAAFRSALQINPDFVLALGHLGNALKEQGRLDEAIVAYRRLLELNPDSPETCQHLGIALTRQGQFNEAVAAYRRALELAPDSVEIHNNLGTALTLRGQFDEAMTVLRRALEIAPDCVEAHINLGNAFNDQHQADQAIAAYRRALEVAPGHPEAHYNLGNVFKDQGQVDEAVAAYRRALRGKPDYRKAHSNLIYTLHFHPCQDDEALAQEHGRWNRQFGEPLKRLIQPHANHRDPERRLRIGYVSPNFHRHPICHFFLPLLKAHDKTRVEIYCYASVSRPDQFTARVKKTADVWRDALGLGEDALAERIRADQIDILVDLTQHMAENRLLTFARKPAPAQVSWLGYPASTGLSAIDYRFTDRFLEPEGSAWSDSVETPIRLPETWCCFDPIDEYPEPSPLPAPRTGQITFGCLNNFCKVNEPLLQLWAKVLQAVESSRLLLQCPAGAAQTRLRQWFEAQGIDAERLDLVTRTATRAEFLQIFERIDIALDPFPYNGGTTTCEALWMGIPVVSLAGHSAVSRVGLSALTNLGLPEWVASSEDDYVRIATQLARDLPGLTGLRRTLRGRMQASPLMDAPRFARNIEAAYRMMWQRWCADQSSSLR